jgi:hypothetical protein
MVYSLYGNVTGMSNLFSVEVNSSHSASTATAIITCGNISVDIGDEISVDIGSMDNHQEIFTGYVKQVERKIPDDVYIITAKDKMVRALDYYFASSNPESPFSRSNILAEDLVQDVLAVAGLTSFTADNTFFTFATGEVNAEVNLVSAYDYANGIADLLAYGLWCDINGTVHFENRKPYPMTGTSGQPGDDFNETLEWNSNYTFTDSNLLGIRYKYDERELRNRIVVYGSSGIYAEASQSSPYLPSGFYKTAVLSSHIITGNAQDIADYNLDLMNRLTYEVECEIEGNPGLAARQLIHLDQSYISGINTNWYAFAVDHKWSRSGYINSLILRK